MGVLFGDGRDWERDRRSSESLSRRGGRATRDWPNAREFGGSGEIGTLKTAQSFFSSYNVNPEDTRNQADVGGGGLMDIGCNPVSASRFLDGSEPLGVHATIEYDSRFETDIDGSAMLEFASARERRWT